MEGLWEILPCPDVILDELEHTDFGNASNNQGYFTLFDELQGSNGTSFNSTHYGNAMFGGRNMFSNLTFPCLDMTDLPTEDAFKRIMTKLNTYFTPIVIVIGATGNLLAFLVFTVTHLRRQSSSVYLASLALADMGFLLSLFIVWLSSVSIPLFTRHIWCQAVVYLTYVCTFLSVWYVVSFTIERYIIVWYPLRKDRFCTPKRARIVVLALAAAACVFYSFGTWTSGVVEVLGLPVCIPYPQYYNFFTAMEGVDAALKLIIPSTIVIVLNIRILMKIISVDKQRRPFLRHSSGNVSGKLKQVNVNICENKCGKLSQHRPESSVSAARIVHVKFKQQPSGQHSSVDRPNGCAQSLVSNNNHSSADHRKFSHSHSQSSEKNRVVASLRTLADSSTEKIKGGQIQQQSCIEFGHKDIIHSIKHEGISEPARQHVVINVQRKSGNAFGLFRSCDARVHVRGNTQYRTARMLIVVSSVFVVLNLPSHVFRVHAFIKTSLTDQIDSTRRHSDVRWHELFQLVYHLNFAINFFIYSVCGRQFRTGLKILYSRLVIRLSKIKRIVLYRRTPAMDF